MGLGAINIENIGGIFSGAGQLLKDIRATITGKEILDPTKLAELEAKSLELEGAIMNAQAEINKIEAGSSRIFVAGWRPFIGWCGGIGVFYHFVGHPLFVWVIAIFNLTIVPPVLDTEGLLSLVFAMLGIGTLRTYEKVKGVVDRH